jgi:aspartate/methionine/tyrosine aminotransferase
MPELRRAITEMENQRIGEVSRLAIGDPDIVPLWFGESDLDTPDFIKQAAVEAMNAGFTRYVNKRGAPELRSAIHAYTNRIYGIDLDPDRITVMSSGMTAIMVACETLVDNGDNVVMLSPVWPNIYYCVQTMGGECRHLRLDPTEDGWKLDLEKLFDACDERTKAIFIHSPSNPTGYLMSREEQQAILEFARARGIWIIADEVYHRIVYDRDVAPSFLQISEPDDPIYAVHSMSKAWCMTGWRCGWMIHPAEWGDRMADLSGINNTGATSFVQQAAAVALSDGEEFVAEMVERCRRGRDLVFQRLGGMERVRLARPDAAFYAFFSIDGLKDDLAFAQELVLKQRVGLAPGTAFGPGNEGFLRLCFAQSEDTLSRGMDRLEEGLKQLA